MAKIKVKKQRCSSNSSSNWADLPDELLDLFLGKLASLPDIIRFSSVCKTWNSMVLIHKEKVRKLINHQPPWILINSMNLKVNNKRKQSLYNLADGSEITKKLKIPYKYKHRECFGLSHGWLFYREFRNRVIVLINPLCGTVIRLPPKFISTKFWIPFDDAKDFILSSDPGLGSFEVLAICSCSDVVAHFKFGDEFWTFSEKRDIHTYSFTFYKNCLLGFDSRSSRLFSLHITHSSKKFHSSKKSTRSIEFKEIPLDFNGVGKPSVTSFVETTNGDLLMVHRYNKIQYKLFKIMCGIGKFCMVPVANLGGDSLFLKEHSYHSIGCISVLALNFDGCRANSIYYASKLRREDDFLKCAVEEFNLKDESLNTKEVRFPKSNVRSTADIAFWMVPSI